MTDAPPPDLRTAAQALADADEAMNELLPHISARTPLGEAVSRRWTAIVAVRAALAAEATEPPPDHQPPSTTDCRISTPGLVIDGPPPTAIDIDPATIAPPSAPTSDDDEAHAFCVPATLWQETLSAARRYREGWTADLTAMKWWAPEHMHRDTPAAMSLGERSAIEAIDAGRHRASGLARMVELQDQIRRSFDVPPEILSGPDDAPSYLVRLYRAGYISPSNARRIVSEMNAALAATGGVPNEPGDDDQAVVGYVVLSDHIDRSTGKHGIDVNWDGELHPTRDAADESAADADDESYADASVSWIRVGVVTIPSADLPPWWGSEREGTARPVRDAALKALHDALDNPPPAPADGQ